MNKPAGPLSCTNTTQHPYSDFLYLKILVKELPQESPRAGIGSHQPKLYHADALRHLDHSKKWVILFYMIALHCSTEYTRHYGVIISALPRAP